MEINPSEIPEGYVGAEVVPLIEVFLPASQADQLEALCDNVRSAVQPLLREVGLEYGVELLGKEMKSRAGEHNLDQ